jgi:hypothetical protein
MRLEHLFDGEYRYEAPPVVAPPVEGGEGRAFGGGVGTVSGERIRGSMRWSNFARFRGDGVTVPDVTGVIETEDGAEILFRIGGYSLKAERGRKVIGPITFLTQHERYRWLNSVVGVMEGVVSPETSSIRSRVYACVHEMAEESMDGNEQ